MSTLVKGIAIAPGVSRNGRLYTRENIARAYARLSERVNAGIEPVVMRTHHDAGDDSTRVVGRVKSVSLTGDGAIAYESELANTTAGRDIAELAKGNDRALAHVSVWGHWVGEQRMIKVDGQLVETADDLEIDKIDFTASPGVVDASARVESFTPSGDAGILAESVRPVAFSDSSVTEALADVPVSMSLSSYAGGFDVNICAWGCSAENIDAFTDTAQRAMAAALAILDGGPVDDDAASETHTQSSTASVVENTKEAPMGTEASTAATTAAETAAVAPEATVTETEGTEPTLGDVLKAINSLVAVLTPPAAESTSTTEPVTEAAETDNTAPDMSALRESIKTEVLAALVKEGVKPTRKGYGLTETTEATADAADAWERRGDDIAKAFGATAEPEPATPVDA